MDFINPQNKISKDIMSRQPDFEPVARILVVGIGGAGNNAVNRMIEDGVLGVEFVGVNTDKQDLKYCKASRKVAIGEKITGGRGCGAVPEIGESAANESKEAIRDLFRETRDQKKADMVFITCGMGGGTGTGAAPIIANIAKEEGILTVAVVTKPFRFEGKVRMNRALAGINRLHSNVDTLITIANDKLFSIVDVNDGFKEAFNKADETLKQAIKGITDLINLPALVNLDFADVSTVMRGKGLAHIAIGESKGENKVINAVKQAIESPLLDTSIDGATDLIMCISGQVSIIDVDAAMKDIEPKLSPDVNVIFGARENEDLKDAVQVTIIATGIKDVNARNSMYMSSNINRNNFNTQPMKNYVQNDFRDNTQQPMGLGAFFARKNQKNENVVSRNDEKRDALMNTKSFDTLNVDLSKLEVPNSDSNNDNLLPSFITNNLNKH